MREEQDPGRPLTGSGRGTSQRMARWLAERVPPPDGIWHSGKTRAEQTARILGDAFDAGIPVSARRGLSPGDDPSDARDALPREGSLILVGHLPHLERMAGLLLAGSPTAAPVSFRNSGIVCLEGSEEGRKQASGRGQEQPSGRVWKLLWAVVPDLVR
jgi:phosphohistidine phosphatase